MTRLVSEEVKVCVEAIREPRIRTFMREGSTFRVAEPESTAAKSTGRSPNPNLRLIGAHSIALWNKRPVVPTHVRCRINMRVR